MAFSDELLKDSLLTEEFILDDLNDLLEALATLQSRKDSGKS